MTFKKFNVKISNTLFLVLFIFSYHSEAIANSEGSELNPETFMTFYYLHPQSFKLIQSLQHDLRYTKAWRLGQINLLIHFHAAAINGSDDRGVLLQRLHGIREQYSGLNRKIIDRVIVEAENFISPQATSSDNFDLLWAEFFATGNPKAVEDIAAYLQLSDDKDRLKVIYLAAAEWSLAANAAQHKKVLEILYDLSDSSTGIMKKRLQKILDNPQAVASKMTYVSHQPKNHKLSWEEYKNAVW